MFGAPHPGPSRSYIRPLVLLVVVCPQLRAVNTSVCSGYCHSGSTRYLSPLGTACVITCNYGNGRPVQTYSRTCVWENDVIGGVHAAWKPDYLPDGITNGERHVTCTSTCLCCYSRPIEYGRPLYFALWFLTIDLLSFSPRLISAVGDWMSTILFYTWCVLSVNLQELIRR